MKKKKDGFFISALSVLIIILIIEINAALLFGPAVLWFITKGWGWFLLYPLTLTIMFAIPGLVQSLNNNKKD